MPRTWLMAILLASLVVTPVLAADKDKPAEKSKNSNAAERAVQNTSKKAEGVADRATNATGRGLKAAEKGVNTAGKATGKALNNAADKTGKWVKEKTD